MASVFVLGATLWLATIPFLVIRPAETRVLTAAGECQERFPQGARGKREVEPLFIELVLVADHSLFLHHGGDLTAVYRYCQSVAEHVDRVYAPLDVRVTLADVVVWSRGDEIEFSSDSNLTLENFAQYRRSSRTLASIPHDTAHLLTKRSFDKGILGRGFVLDTICSFDWSCGVLFALDEPRRAGSALAHELGHNLGMHDERDSAADACTASCGAPGGCVMGTGSGGAWSDCSRRVLERYFTRDENCLRNRPKKTFHLSAPEAPAPKPVSSEPPSAWGIDDDNDIATSTSLDLNVLLVVDETTIRRERLMQGDAKQYYGLSLIKSVNDYLKQIGVNVLLADVMPLSIELQNSIVDVQSSDSTLDNFRYHMLTQRQRDTGNIQYHVAILMTDAVYASKIKLTTTGSSWVGGACSADHEFGVVSTNQPPNSVAVTLAHELGHLLGLRHDEDEPLAATPVPGCPDRFGRYIMAKVIGEHTTKRLSQCSVSAWRNGLEKTVVNCLRFSGSNIPSQDENNGSGDPAPTPSPRVVDHLVVVRVLLVVGESTYRKYGGEQYCRSLMETVQSYFLSLGIELQTVGVKYLSSGEEQGLVDSTSADRTLKAFNAFASKMHRTNEAQFHIAILLSDNSYPYTTRNGDDTRFTIKGTSFPGEVCHQESGNAIVSTEQGSARHTALTLAHELGHALGMLDEERRVDGVPSCPHAGGAHIMSGVLVDDIVADWSPCSRDTWKAFYKSESSRCLWEKSITAAIELRPQSNERHGSDQIKKHDTTRTQTALPPSRAQGSEPSRDDAPRRPNARTMKVKVLLVFGNSTLAARGENAYSRGRELIEAVDYYFAPLGVSVEQAGWARLDSNVETKMKNLENLYDFQRIVRRGKLQKGLPQHYVAILISHLVFSSSDKLGHSFKAGACSRENYMGTISSRPDDWKVKLALAQEIAHLLGIGDEQLMTGVPRCDCAMSAGCSG